MYIVQVHVKVKAEFVDLFIAATLENARNSILEPGVARFDVIQDLDEPSHVILVEVYRTVGDAGKQKETIHYSVWRETVADMMAEPRTSKKYANIYPEDQGW